MSEQDLIFSDAFAKYRKREIGEAVKIVSDIFRDSVNPEYIKGSLDLLKRILYIPKQIAKTKEAIEMADIAVERDLKEFEIKFLRRFIE